MEIFEEHMNTQSNVAPADVLIATLYKVCSDGDIRMASDRRLTSAFDDASKEYPGLYGEFRAHPVYKDSKILRTLLQSLDLGAAIVRENATIYYFRAAPPLRGAFGREYFDKLNGPEQEMVSEVAKRIRNVFTSPV